MDMILETPRLYLRKIEPDDYSALCSILQDIEVMYAWEHAFTDAEVLEWMDENRKRYDRDGFSYWAVIEKASDRLIGAAGVIAERAEGEECAGIGYIFNKKYWGNGYALESAGACAGYAFHTLHLDEITAQIRPENTASRKVAEKLGMKVKKQFIKHHQGKNIPHLLYHCVK